MPCNNCDGHLVLGDAAVDRTRTLRLVAAEDWPYAARTAGEPTQPCFNSQCFGDLPIGCNGNDVEVHCAPALPSRIIGLQGRVRQGLGGEPIFEVSRVELDEDAPREQVIDGIRMYE